MKEATLRFVVLGLSITSSWGNGHAATYRALLRALAALDHDLLFLERDAPWFAANRDLPQPTFCRTELYTSLRDLQRRFDSAVRDADVVIVGSNVPEGIAVGEWATRTTRGVAAFYDIDAPVTLARLDAGTCEYLTADLVPRYPLYLSFTGGPALDRIECTYGSPAARPLYCTFDPALFHADDTQPMQWDLGYMGTYSSDRQPTLERLLNDTARRWGGGRFVVAGRHQPDIRWPANVERIEHLDPSAHRQFYCRQRFTLNVTRAAMIEAGYSPNVRLFEAAACGTPIISDQWQGLDTLFEPHTEILLPRSSREVLELLVDLDERERRSIGERARARVLQQHTPAQRARELVAHVHAVRSIVPSSLTHGALSA